MSFLTQEDTSVIDSENWYSFKYVDYTPNTPKTIQFNEGQVVVNLGAQSIPTMIPPPSGLVVGIISMPQSQFSYFENAASLLATNVYSLYIYIVEPGVPNVLIPTYTQNV